MIELYQMERCPFCVKVRLKLEELQLDWISRTSPPGSPQREKLMEMGGVQQVPFFVDSEHGVSMYESDDIINYLEETYG